jgi:hypothetical protein
MKDLGDELLASARDELPGCCIMKEMDVDEETGRK